MKKLTLFFVLGFANLAQAQQLPLFSQYYFNSFIYNPSHTGLEGGTTATMVARKQFTGLDNSIGTYAATLQSRSIGQKSGFGLYMYNDNANLFRTNAVSGSYAYHIPLNNGKTMSLGLSLSALDHRFNSTSFITTDEGDPIIALLGNEGGFTLDGNAGVNFDLGKFSIGLANLQMFQSQEAFKSNSNNKVLYTLANHWMFNMGYEYSINEHFNLEPYLLYRKTQAAPGQVDINLFLNWVDKGYAGIAYRDGMSFSTMLGVNLTPTISAGYSFDLTTSELRNVIGNTHEVALRFDIGRTKTPNTTNDGEILASSDKKKYENKISDLEAKLTDLESRKEVSGTTDTIIVERVVVKEVIKEVPVIKEVIKVIKEVPATKTATVDKPIETNTPVVTKPTTIPPKKSVTYASTNYYVIAGSFANSTAASAYIKKLANQGHTAYEWYDSSSGRYYVHLGKYVDKSEAVSLIQTKKGSGLPLWVKTIK